MCRIPVIVIVMLFFVSTFHAQSVKLDSLNKKINKNESLFKKEPQKAFQEIDLLLAEAIELENAEAELKILSIRYKYDYLLKIDFEQMISSANILKDRAKAHKNLFYEAIAHKYLSQVYTFNGLYDKSLEELELSLETINKINPETPEIIIERANIFAAFTNVYMQKDEPFRGIQYIHKAVDEHEKLTDPELKRGTKFMDYANLGAGYLNVNLDSARYYANKSISYSRPDEYNHNLMFINHLVLGNVFLEKKEYNQAIAYYNKAESIEEGKYFMNLKELYENYIKIYEATGEDSSKQDYELKLKDLSLTIAQSQSNSLRKIIQNDKKAEINRQTEIVNKGHNYWIWGGVFGLGIAFLLVFKYYKRNKVKESNTLTPEAYKELINLLKKNDQTFLLTFEAELPSFIEALRKECPDLTNAEIELLAMIKLGLTNKEIANYKFIQHKTVQNKRHIIRKKLNLSNTIYLNKWVDNLV